MTGRRVSGRDLSNFVAAPGRRRELGDLARVGREPDRQEPLLLLATTTASSNENLVLPPLPDATGPAKLLVLVPGANVATSYYNATARAIQAHTHTAKLWVVVPKIPGETCIAFCPSPHVCAPLHVLVEGAVAEAGAFDAADRFLAGHSLGGVCAATLAVAYDGAYAAAAMLGSYVTASVLRP